MTRRQLVWRIARHELTELTRAGTYRGAALLLGVAVFVGLVAGVLHYQRITATTVDAVTRERARWLTQPPRDPHSASHFGQTAFHTRAPLSAFDSGVDPFVGVSVFLESHKRNLPRYAWAADTPRGSGLGHYTAATALRVFLPLFLVLITYGTIVGERERGTLALTMASGVAPGVFVVGKMTGLAMALGLVAVPVCIAGAVTLTMGAAAPGSWDWLWRASGLAVAYLAYGFVFIAVGLAVSAWTRSSATARAVLFAFWTVSTLVSPRALTDLAVWIHPVPSSVEFQKAVDDDPDRYLGAKGRDDFRRTVLADYGVSSVDELPVNFNALWALKSEEHSTRIFDQHFSAIDRAFAASARFVTRGSWFGPTLAVDGLSMALAGSDLGHYAHFLDAAEAHRRTMVRLLNEDLVRRPDARRAGYRAGPELWASIPPFDYRPPHVWWALREGRGAAWALGVWGALSLGLAAAAARHVARTPLGV